MKILTRITKYILLNLEIAWLFLKAIFYFLKSNIYLLILKLTSKIQQMAKRISYLHREKKSVKRRGVHAKTKTSKNKKSANYRKKYKGQGR